MYSLSVNLCDTNTNYSHRNIKHHSLLSIYHISYNILQICLGKKLSFIENRIHVYHKHVYHQVTAVSYSIFLSSSASSLKCHQSSVTLDRLLTSMSSRWKMLEFRFFLVNFAASIIKAAAAPITPTASIIMPG